MLVWEETAPVQERVQALVRVRVRVQALPPVQVCKTGDPHQSTMRFFRLRVRPTFRMLQRLESFISQQVCSDTR